MKKFALMIFGLAMCLPAYGWNCSVAGEGRVQVPASYVGNGPGDGNNQVVADGGLNFACLPDPIPPSGATANSGSTSGATSGSTSTATGGNANATGGNVNNSGNSSNANTLSQKQGQKQSQSQSNTSTNNNQSAGGSVSNVGNSQTLVEAPQIPVNTAVAPPVFSTTNCFKGYSAGAQTPLIGGSFGGGGIDKNCAAERIAQDYYAMGNRLAACKVITNTKASKDAGVTMADCMNVPVPVVRTVVPIVSTPAPAPIKVEITNNIPPAPAPIILHEAVNVTAPRPQAKKRATHRPCSVTPIQNECPVREK